MEALGVQFVQTLAQMQLGKTFDHGKDVRMQISGQFVERTAQKHIFCMMIQIGALLQIIQDLVPGFPEFVFHLLGKVFRIRPGRQSRTVRPEVATGLVHFLIAKGIAE